MKNLVIVESPTKAKKIEKFLGPDYKVMSSYGHIRDLSKKDLGISEEGRDFAPVYEIPDDKKDLVRQLRAAAKQADTVWLASDEDREGEAIAWHLAEVLHLDPKDTRRIVFHEITKPAILHAIENPRHIDIDRVNAQQARRVLDRIVGFELSPVLWKKIKPALSAGRVQSVAVRLICEREKEIDAFKPESYFRVTALFSVPGSRRTFKAEYPKRLKNEEEARKFLEACRNAEYRVSDISIKPLKRSPQPPFTTSTLQQEAGRRLGFSVKKTMMVAQKLYEEGQITYMRTDSLNLSTLAVKDISATIGDTYGEGFIKNRHYHTNSKGAQEAHEAIRPTYATKHTIEGSSDEKRLYDLIWRRAVASQMADATVEKTTVEILAYPVSDDPNVDMTVMPIGKFQAEGEVVTFEGFMKAYAPEASEKTIQLPAINNGEKLSAKEVTATERFTQAPPRYTESTLVKKMEELGIGRPATYAPTISTIQARDYVRRGEKDGEKRCYRQLTLEHGQISEGSLYENSGSDKGKLVPTDVGMIVNDFLTEHFPDILDYNFTARVEEKFDEIAEGKLGWKQEINGFYDGFHPSIVAIDKMRLDHKIGERVLGTDPKSGRPVSVKIGRYGPLVQIGEATDEEKPLFASLKPDQSISTITLDEALKLFELPRTVGEYEGQKITAAAGRFGPYIKHGSLFVSIPKNSGLTPEGINLEESIALIEEKREKVRQSHIKDFPEMPGLQVLNGRFGPYIAYKPEGASKAVNYKIPKGTDPASLTLDEAKALMAAQDAAPKKTVRKTATAKKTTSRKSK